MSRRNLIAQIKSLEQYQLALTSFDDQEEISDYCAKDFATICQEAQEIANNFLEESFEENKSIITDTPSVLSRLQLSFGKLYQLSPSISWANLLRTVDSLTRAARTYVEYRKLNELREATKRRAQPRKRQLRKWNCQFCTYLNRSNSKVCDMCLKSNELEVFEEDHNEGDEKVGQQTNKSKAFTLEKAAVAIAAVGTGVASVRSLYKSKGFLERAEELALCREGKTERLNGDYTAVAPVNTGRILESDIEHLVSSIEDSGLHVPVSIQQTAGNVRRLVSKINNCLLAIEEFYDSQMKNEFKKGSLLLGTFSVIVLSLLGTAKPWANRLGIFAAVITATFFYPSVNASKLESAREKVITLLSELRSLQSQRDERKDQIRNLESAAVRRIRETSSYPTPPLRAVDNNNQLNNSRSIQTKRNVPISL